MNDLIESMAAAVRAGEALPPMPEGLTIEAAYEVQEALVRAVAGDALAGYKAGLTAPVGQAQFGIDHPLVGALYEAGRLESGAVFAGGAGVSLECEMGVVIDADGTPRSAGPVIEVPRIGFSRREDATGINLCACNIAADRIVAGTQSAIRDDYGALGVTLTRDGETVLEASLDEALGGPVPAVAWMVGTLRDLGRPLADGMLLITGALGGIHPAEPGAYVADYGVLGQVTFTVT